MSSFRARRSTSRPPRASSALALLLLAGGCSRGGPPPTYSQDIAPLVRAHCAGCHRPGQGAPFTLLSYADVKSRADEIVTATGARVMPPWLPDKGPFPFVGERRLTAEQISMLQRWAAAGAPEGGPIPLLPATEGAWQLGVPDLVVSPARAYTLAPGHDDVFRNLVIRTTLDGDRYVRAVEFKPGAAPVHHAVVHLDRTAGSRRRDAADGRPGFEGMGAPGTSEPDGHFVGWAPGRGPILSADGKPWRLARGTFLVIEMHLIPGKQPIDVLPSVALYFAESSGTEATGPVMVKMGSNAIDIPPGVVDYAITDRFVLPVDVDLLSLYPHAHFLGNDMQVIATLPDGSIQSLLHIRRWSFHWQQDYRFATPVPLPRGTTIGMRFTYDNSDANPQNPHHPPVRVTVGQRSTDEMGNLLLQFAPRSSADRALLLRDVEARQALAEVANAEMLVRANPTSGLAHSELGSALLRANRPDEAIEHFRRALALDPDLPEAHDEVGVWLFARGQLAEALVHLRRAVELAPDNAIAHSDLGGALAQAGQVTEATQHLRRALALDPDNAAAKENLARLKGR